MKKLLISTVTLTLALACQPLLGQEAAAPASAEIASPLSPQKVTSPESPKLRGRVQFEGANLPEVIDYLNGRIKEQGAEPMNLVVGPGLDQVKVPSMTLQNVSATDVLNVVAKLTGLSLEPVQSDLGGVAAWIISRPNAGIMMSGFHGGGLLRADIAGDSAQATVDLPAPASVPEGTGGIPGSDSGGSLNPAGEHGAGDGASAGLGGGNGAPTDPHIGGGPAATPVLGQWVELGVAARPPAKVNRVLGIGKIYEGIADPDERAKKEYELGEMLSVVAKEQKVDCKVRLYDVLKIVVVTGSPEGVELIEQTVSALKENAGAKPTANPSRR